MLDNACFLDPPEVSNHKLREYEILMWCPTTPSLATNELDAYLTMCKSLATLARAYYPPASLRHPSLVVSAACASRDTTVQLALDSLHNAGYSITNALKALAPPEQAPILRLDEMEEWSVVEGNLFEEALEKCGKSFHDIQTDILPWKSTKVGYVIRIHLNIAFRKTQFHYIYANTIRFLEKINLCETFY